MLINHWRTQNLLYEIFEFLILGQFPPLSDVKEGER
jgi:hypothetical protein